MRFKLANQKIILSIIFLSILGKIATQEEISVENEPNQEVQVDIEASEGNNNASQKLSDSKSDILEEEVVQVENEPIPVQMLSEEVLVEELEEAKEEGGDINVSSSDSLELVSSKKIKNREIKINQPETENEIQIEAEQSDELGSEESEGEVEIDLNQAEPEETLKEEESSNELEQNVQSDSDSNVEEAENFVLENLTENSEEEEPLETEKSVPENFEVPETEEIDVSDLINIEELPVLVEDDNQTPDQNQNEANSSFEVSAEVVSSDKPLISIETQSDSEDPDVSLFEEEMESLLKTQENKDEDQVESKEKEQESESDKTSQETETIKAESDLESDSNKDIPDAIESENLDNVKLTSEIDPDSNKVEKTQEIRTGGSTVIQTISSQGQGESSSSSSSGISRRNSATDGNNKILQVTGNSSEGEDNVVIGDTFTLVEENKERQQKMMNAVFGDEEASMALNSLNNQLKEEGKGDIDSLNLNFDILNQGLNGQSNAENLIGNDFQVPTIETTSFEDRFRTLDFPFGNQC